MYHDDHGKLRITPSMIAIATRSPTHPQAHTPINYYANSSSRKLIITQTHHPANSSPRKLITPQTHTPINPHAD
jgi:hypothetical protein